MDKHLIWINPLSLPWRLGLLGALVLIAGGVIGLMATQGLPTVIGILLLLVVAVVTTVVHRIGTFLHVDGDVLRFGRYPRPQDEILLTRIKGASVEDLPADERVTKPWGTLALDASTTLVDVNRSTRAVVLSFHDGRTVKIGVGSHSPSAEDFVAGLREQNRSIHG